MKASNSERGRLSSRCCSIAVIVTVGTPAAAQRPALRSSRAAQTHIAPSLEKRSATRRGGGCRTNTDRRPRHRVPTAPRPRQKAITALAQIIGARRHKIWSASPAANMAPRVGAQSLGSSSIQLEPEPEALRPTHRDRRSRHRRTDKTAAQDGRRLDPPRSGVVLRVPPLSPRPQCGNIDSALVREHGMSLSARAIPVDRLLPLTARSLPSALLVHPCLPGLGFFHPLTLPVRAHAIVASRLNAYFS